MWQITLTVGTQFDRDNNTIPPLRRDSALALIDAYAVHKFGGYSRYTMRGGWKAPNGGVVYEESERYEIITENSDGKSPFAAFEFALYVKETLAQQSVMIAVQELQADFV